MALDYDDFSEQNLDQQRIEPGDAVLDRRPHSKGKHGQTYSQRGNRKPGGIRQRRNKRWSW